jgi:hypothetical protein
MKNSMGMMENRMNMIQKMMEHKSRKKSEKNKHE